MTTITVQECRTGLTESGRRRREAEQLRADALADLNAWIVAALDAGIGPSEVARLGGVSRQHIHHLVHGR